MEPMANAYGLVVGIAAYQHVRPLPAVVTRDARDVYEFLVDPARGGHRPENTRLLVDAQATGQALRAQLADLAERTSADGTAFIYLSCHGVRIRNVDDYVLPVDVAGMSDAALARTAISGDEFGEALGRLPVRRVLVVFDCCHAGGIGTPKSAAWPGPSREPGLSEAGYEALAGGRGRAILASSRDDELAVVLPGAANSLFTTHLLAGLDGGVASDDGLVRVFDLFEYLQPRVTADSPGQHPVFKGNLEENFPVALYAGGRHGTVRRSDDGFRYDAYVSYVDREPDATWVWDQLLPRLERAGLRIAVSGDVERPGVARVVGIERGIQESRRTLVILSRNYLSDGFAHFENVLAQTLGVAEGRYRLVPVRIAPLDGDLPARLSMLVSVNLTPGRRAEREFKRLMAALEAPLPPHDGAREPGAGA
jgi:hypothetical protein